MDFLNHVLKSILCTVARRKMITKSHVGGVEGKEDECNDNALLLMETGLVLNPHYQMVTDQQE